MRFCLLIAHNHQLAYLTLTKMSPNHDLAWTASGWQAPDSLNRLFGAGQPCALAQWGCQVTLVGRWPPDSRNSRAAVRTRSRGISESAGYSLSLPM